MTIICKRKVKEAIEALFYEFVRWEVIPVEGYK